MGPVDTADTDMAMRYPFSPVVTQRILAYTVRKNNGRDRWTAAVGQTPGSGQAKGSFDSVLDAMEAMGGRVRKGAW